MTLGGLIFLLVMVLLIAPEIIIFPILICVFLLFGLGEFMLRLFGKSFDDPPTSKMKKSFEKRKKKRKKKNIDIDINI